MLSPKKDGSVLKTLYNKIRLDIQVNLILFCLDLLHFTDVTFFTNWRRDPPPAKRLHPFIAMSGTEPKCLQGMPVQETSEWEVKGKVEIEKLLHLSTRIYLYKEPGSVTPKTTEGSI